MPKKLAPELATTCITAEYPNFDTTKVDASGASPWHAGLKPADHGDSVAPAGQGGRLLDLVRQLPVA